MSSRLSATLRTGIGVVVITAVQSVVIALTFILLANRLEPAAYGSIAFAMAAGGFAPIIAGLGGEFVLVMYGSRDPAAAPELLGNALVTRLLLSVVLAVATHALGTAAGYQDILTLDLVAVGLLVAALADPLLVAWFRVERRLLEYYLISFAGRTLLLVFVLAAVRVPADVHLAAAGYLVSQLLVTGVALAAILRRTRIRVSRARAWAHRRESVIFTASQLVDVAATRMDVLILYAVTTLAAVGVYNAGYRIATVLLTLPAAVQSVVLPEFHLAAAEDADRLRRVFHETLASLTEMAVLACGLVIASHSHIVAVLLSPEYAGAGLVLALIALTMGVTYVSYAYAMLAESQQRIGWRLAARVATAVVGFAATAVLAARWGAAGAAGGALITSVLFLLLLSLITGRGMPHQPRVPVGPLAIGAVSAALVVALARGVTPGWQGLVFTASIYVAAVAGLAWLLHRLGAGEPRSFAYIRHIRAQLAARSRTAPR